MILDWLFPDVAAARQAALARINALKARHDAIDAQYKTISALARDIAPLIQEAEIEGGCPVLMRLELTAEDCDQLDAANRELFRLGNENHFEPVGNGATLFGVRIVRGTQRRVFCLIDSTSPTPKGQDTQKDRTP